MTETPDLAPLVEQLVDDGVDVIWLAGSRARGDHGPYSDLDIGVIQASPRPRVFTFHNGIVTSIVWTTTDLTRASFRDPGQVGAAVPGWRAAVLLHDPKGIGRRLREEATDWHWDSIAPACDRWVARELVGLSEEIAKISNALDSGDTVFAAERRNALVGRLPLVMSVRERILYDSERFLWSAVANAMGEEWSQAQSLALALSGEELRTSVKAAFTMFEIAATRCHALFTSEQDAVVSTARAWAESLD